MWLCGWLPVWRCRMDQVAVTTSIPSSRGPSQCGHLERAHLSAPKLQRIWIECPGNDMSAPCMRHSSRRSDTAQRSKRRSGWGDPLQSEWLGHDANYGFASFLIKWRISDNSIIIKIIIIIYIYNYIMILLLLSLLLLLLLLYIFLIFLQFNESDV